MIRKLAILLSFSISLSMFSQEMLVPVEVIDSGSILYERTKNHTVVPIEPVNEELLGVYYSVDFYNFNSEYFTITREKPLDVKPRTYRLKFLENGECKWKDLTSSYSCGNSIILIKRIQFKKEGELYNIRIQGTKNLSHDFDFNGLYRFRMKDGKYILELASILKDEIIN